MAKNVLTDSDETLNKRIRISCKGAENISIDELTEFQGNLKTLPEDRYQKLRSSILKHGYSFPANVWKFKNKKYIIDAHQRVLTLKRMRDEEGFVIPKIPVNYIDASTKKEAAEKVLAATSQFGEMSGDGLHAFMEEYKLELDVVTSSFNFPEISFAGFRNEFFGESREVSFKVKDTKNTSKELDIEEFSKFEHSCPKCGFSFN